MNGVILETASLTKSYGALKAIDGFTLQLEEGRIYGLLGRNGAGKTTLLNLASSRIFADSGHIRLFGQNAVENQSVLSKVCYMPEKNLFISSMRVAEILKDAGLFYDSFDMAYARRLCEKFSLEVKKSYKSLSRGYESILRMVIGLASRAPLTIFDEPVLGLDAAVRDMFYRELLEDYTENPRTFIISTHLIEESADIFEEVIIINEGVLLEKLPVEELKGKARYVSGRAAEVEAAVSGLRVVHSEMIGSVKVSAVYDDLDEDTRKRMASYEVDISTIPVQKLFIYLTEKVQGR